MKHNYLFIQKDDFLTNIFEQFVEFNCAEDFQILYFNSFEELFIKLKNNQEKERQDVKLVVFNSGILNNIPKSNDFLFFLNSSKIPSIVVCDNIDNVNYPAFFESNLDNIIEIKSKPKDIYLKEIEHILKKCAFVLKNSENEYSEKILIDAKTGLYTQQAFEKKVSELMKANPDNSYVLFHFDLDRFKVYNEIYGFKSGDKVLSVIGEFLLKNISNKYYTSRIRAEHFVICIPENELNAEKLLSDISKVLNGVNPGFFFIVKAGLYRYESPDENPSLGISRALMALKSIKTEFMQQYAYYDKSMSESLVEEQELIGDMVEALKNEEFLVYFQPQYDYTKESLTGAEALVRWNHHSKGLISPAKFIPVFEKNGLITQLDEYVWDKTCKKMRNWIDDGLNPVPVSVNISRKDIYNLDIINTFDKLLEKYELTPDLIRLEITESAYMDNPVQLVNVVESLQNRGFCVEMDDFGSGYSSLNTLKDVPVDILKLDMRFIMDEIKSNDSNDNSKSGSILSSVVRMANWLQLPVIAEGIETKEQAEYLKSIGCFHMQGFYFAKPMPENEYEELLTTLPKASEKPAENSKMNNAVKFLDASTQATLLFNSFVGGAAIIEWTGTNVEVLRINDQYLEEIGTTSQDYAPLQKDLLAQLDENSRPIFLSNLLEAQRSSNQTFCEVRCLPIYKNTSPFWLRIRVRHLAKTITSDIFYMSIDNIDFRMKLLELNTNLSEQLADVMETVPCGIMTLHYIPGTDISVSYMNESCAKISGYTQSEFRAEIRKNHLKIFVLCDSETTLTEINEEYLQYLIKENKNNFEEHSIVNNHKIKLNGKFTRRSDGTYEISIIIED